MKLTGKEKVILNIIHHNNISLAQSPREQYHIAIYYIAANIIHYHFYYKDFSKIVYSLILMGKVKCITHGDGFHQTFLETECRLVSREYHDSLFYPFGIVWYVMKRIFFQVKDRRFGHQWIFTGINNNSYYCLRCQKIYKNEKLIYNGRS